MEPSSLDERRIAQLTQLFAEKGLTLHVDQEPDGQWCASVHHSEIGPTETREVRAWTPLEAAEVAWAKFQRDRYLGAASETAE